MKAHRWMTALGTWAVTGKREASRFAAVVFTGLLIVPNAQAEPISLIASDDPAVPSFFTLDFGDAGGVASTHITFTDIEIEVDPDLGTSRFLHYYQEVEPLLLPGGFSTGDLTIEIVEGSLCGLDMSAGTYDELTGELASADCYRIEFTGDLGAFGLQSPVFLPGASTGSVTLDVNTGGHIALDWIGDGELANPFDPNGPPLTFSYICTVHAAFAAVPVSLIRLALIPDVLNLGLPPSTEDELVASLFRTLDELNRGSAFHAVVALRVFIESVEMLSGGPITESVADMLISFAHALIGMLDGTLAIPTVSEWGLVVMTLLLLTGAKIYFGRRCPSEP